MAAPRFSAAPTRGFTLIELLVAISIMALMAILGWRGLDGMSRAQVATPNALDAPRRKPAVAGFLHGGRVGMATMNCKIRAL